MKEKKKKKSECDLLLLCRQLLGHPPALWTSRSLKLYTLGCCWPGCSERPSLCARNPYPTDTSYQMQCHVACPPAESLWTGRRVSERDGKKGKVKYVFYIDCINRSHAMGYKTKWNIGDSYLKTLPDIYKDICLKLTPSHDSWKGFAESSRSLT